MNCERGNISRALLAFIVDQYLARNQFSQTRACFRHEASSLFANALPNQNMLSLEEMLSQYILMKKQNIELEKEKVLLMQEKNRIQRLLQDMQNAMTLFNASSPWSNNNVAGVIANSALVPPMQNSITTLPPVASTTMVFPVQNTTSLPPSKPSPPMNSVNFSTPMVRGFDQNRKDSPAVYESGVAKKPRGRPPGKKKPVQGPKQVQGINMPLPSPVNKVDFGSSSGMTQSMVGNFAISGSHISTTHPTPFSFHSDTHGVTPVTGISPVATCNGEVIVPSSNVISTIMVEPQEQMVYKENNRGISPPEASKSDSVDKTSTGVLDVNSSHTLENLDKSFSKEISTSESERERDNYADLDFPNRGLDDWSKIDFSSFGIEDSFTNLSRDIEMQNQEFFDHQA
ncbi:hypothetical protein PHAVU_010G006900 [Phaseolus vulgaris]|uniref:Uncharacterized protein n=1 Tax=Phaseolus vulgaris TaxID=3885 RepID=V7AK78_PHAVU|nr:hypothetical protein PHAVU_010G006900g [Phaseolus vulgaris]ESW05954.1 hypothetical protein PHAVU_010G006900g [Phaseolus vulgaris]